MSVETFRVIIFCPKKYETMWAWSFPVGRRLKIRCSCNVVSKLTEPGIYEISKFSPCTRYLLNSGKKIQYLRIFPKRSEAVIIDGVSGIILGNDFFMHGVHGCDVIVGNSSKVKVYYPSEKMFEEFEL